MKYKISAGLATIAAMLAVFVTVGGDLNPNGTPTPTPTSTATTTATPSATPDDSTVANLWIDTNGGSCPRHGIAVTYVDSEACSSMATALTVAQAGDKVGIQPGAYGRQGLSGTTKAVSFVGSGQGSTIMGQLVSSSTNLTFSHMTFENRNRASGQCSDPPNAVVYPCGVNQTFDDVDIDGLAKSDAIGLRGPGDGFVIKNSKIHGIRDLKGMEIGPNNALIDNNDLYDIKNTVPSGNHTECLYYDGGSNTTISRNRFFRCPIMAILFTQYVNGPPYSNITLENNVFGHPETNAGVYGGCTLNFGGNANRSFIGWVVRNNTIETCVLGGDSPTIADAGASSWYNNLGGRISCAAEEWAGAFNVGETCGDTGDVPVSPAINESGHPNWVTFYVDAPGDNFRLKSGSNAAVGAGNPASFPSIDNDGNTRITPPDAGAYERSS